LVRALEVCLAGKKFSQKSQGKPLFDVLQIGLEISKEKLRQNIEKRVNQMLKKGLEKEVKDLVKKYGWTSVLKNTIGYSEWQNSLNLTKLSSELNLVKFRNKRKKELAALISLHTTQLAKRQLAWFKKDKRIIWLKSPRQAANLIKNFTGDVPP